MTPVLVDSNVLLDVATDDPVWSAWSGNALREAADSAVLVINPLIYAEVSIGYARIEEVEAALADGFRRDPLRWEAAFLAGKMLRRLPPPRERTALAASGLLHWGARGGGRFPPAYSRCLPLSQFLSRRAADPSALTPPPRAAGAMLCQEAGRNRVLRSRRQDPTARGRRPRHDPSLPQRPTEPIIGLI